jgi:hypothetical protein
MEDSMAKKQLKRKVAKKATKVSERESVPVSGPLTLEEAKRIVHARHPSVATKAISKGVVQPTSPASVGAERKELRKKQQQEIARREQEYTAVMRLLKKREVRKARGTADKGHGATVVLAKPSFKPLQILAEGDSWFDYPVPFFGGGIIPRLESLLGVPILNLAKAGDEVRYMLGVTERKELVSKLRNGCPAGGPWDLLLFSGGGNDIVGDPMTLWIKSWDGSISPESHLIKARFEAALELVKAGYEDLIDLRNKLSPGTHLVFHAYDYSIPDGRGICNLGPWLKPTFDFRNFPTQAAAQRVVRSMIDQFSDMLTLLAQANGVTFIKTPGSLPVSTSSWHNELHPSKQGFKMFAIKFQEQIRVLFPDRVS